MQIVTHVIEPRAKEEVLAAGGAIKDLAQVVDQHPHCNLYLVILPAHARASSARYDGTYDITMTTNGRVVTLNATIGLDASSSALEFEEEYTLTGGMYDPT